MTPEIQHTHHLSQWVTIVGRKCQMWKRPKMRGSKQKYTAPQPAGVVWKKSKAEALAFKAQYDKPTSKGCDFRDWQP